MNNFFKQSGQTLLELIFAMGILLIVVTSVLALTISNITGQKESENQIIANNLARESIEVIRNKRDSNWLARLSWDTGLFDSSRTINTAITVFNETDNDWNINFTNNESDYVLYRSYRHVFRHYNLKPITDNVTGFSRHLILDDICLSDSTKIEFIDFPCSADSTKIGIRIKSIVNWTHHSRKKQIIVEDLLYDWK